MTDPSEPIRSALNPQTDLRFPADVPDDYDGYEYTVDGPAHTVDEIEDEQPDGVILDDK